MSLLTYSRPHTHNIPHFHNKTLPGQCGESFSRAQGGHIQQKRRRRRRSSFLEWKDLTKLAYCVVAACVRKFLTVSKIHGWAEEETSSHRSALLIPFEVGKWSHPVSRSLFSWISRPNWKGRPPQLCCCHVSPPPFHIAQRDVVIEIKN